MVEPPERKQLRRKATQKEHFVFRKSVSPRRFDPPGRHNGAVGSVGDSPPGIKSGSRRAHAPKDKSTSRSHQIILGAGIFKSQIWPIHPAAAERIYQVGDVLRRWSDALT